MKLAAEYNKRLNADRKTIRTAYFDMQTFAVHYPRTNKGRMRVVKRAAPGTYPVAMIPGQFVDSYKIYGPNQLKHFPLNSVTSAPPPAGITTKVTFVFRQKRESYFSPSGHEAGLQGQRN